MMTPSAMVATSGQKMSSNAVSRRRKPPFNPMASNKYVDSNDVTDSGKLRSLFSRTATAPRTKASTAGDPTF